MDRSKTMCNIIINSVIYYIAKKKKKKHALDRVKPKKKLQKNISLQVTVSGIRCTCILCFWVMLVPILFCGVRNSSISGGLCI